MERPKPRPAPVISATLPARRPAGTATGRPSGAPGRGGLLQPEPGQVDGLGPPHAALAQDELDEPLHYAQARGAADDLRVGEPVEEAALGVEALELLGPDLPHVLLAPDAVADRRHRAPHEEGGVVVAPRGREFHQRAVLEIGRAHV